ncbi:MAG: hypothetical protein JEZ08_20080 [Clostridiales bacterium]|nr:hypothetical protein [Clostridiales bacterium]
MNYKDEQFKLISEAVMEQLGIEEVDDPLEIVPFETMTEKIVDLKEQLDKKEKNINELENMIEHLTERVTVLEKLFFKLKSQKR